MPDERDLPENQANNDYENENPYDRDNEQTADFIEGEFEEHSDPNPDDELTEDFHMRDSVDRAGTDTYTDAYEEIDEYNVETMPHPSTGTEPVTLDDDTDEYFVDDPDVPFHLPHIKEGKSTPPDERNNPYKMVTMPMFQEPGASDPRVTLPGTGGLDPNPDMPAPQHSTETMARIPSVQQADYNYPAPNAPYQRPAPQQAAYPQPQPSAYRPNMQPQPKPMPHRRRRRRIMGLRPGCVYLMLGLIVTFCGGMTLLTAVSAAVFIPRIEEQWNAELARVDDYQAFESTFILDRYGNSLFEAFGEGRRVSVPYSRFPEALINATIAIEDDSFFTNPGIDVAATMVAFLQFVGAEADETTPGGSTITQQVVRNVLFDFEKRAERSVQRKAEEIVLALLLTQRKSKEEILELYLNEIYYGNLAYGAQMASQVFFGKDVEDLTIGEAALLAGLPQAPANLDPLNPDPQVQSAVDARWRQVLNEMVEESLITDAQRNEALNQGLNYVTPQTSLRAPHFTVYAQAEFERLMTDLGFSPDALSRGGFRVYTTIDQNVNTLALGAARTQIGNISHLNASNSAVVVLKPLTGEIIAMVGSIDYNNDAIDGRVNVATAFRQPGSTMKPFTYSAAMERGLTAGDVIWDTRTEIGIPGQDTYVPVNYDRTYHGPMTIRTALANSFNVPAVQTLRLVGVDYLLELMNRFGVESLGTDASRYGLSLTLGGGEVTLVELTNAYSVFANQGSYVPVTSILCVVDSDSNIVYQYENGCPEGAGNFTPNTVDRTGFGRQVLDPRIAFTITDILSDNQARSLAMGSNSALYTPGIDSSVKTGTTDDWKDNWTVGFTRNVAIGVWVGNNDGDPMSSQSSGLTSAAPIWNSVMNSIYADSGVLDVFRVGGQLLQDKANSPQGISLRQICDVRNLRDPATTCSTRNEWLLDGPPGVPDTDGNLFYPNQPIIQASGSSTLTEYSPGVYRSLVYQIPENVAASIQFQLQPGDKQPLPPKYCNVPQDLQSVALGAGAQELLFIGAPVTSQGDRVEAERYARSAGLAMLPTIDCWAEVFNYQSVNPVGERVITTFISQPANGSTIQGGVEILGTAWFNERQGDFYHLYIRGGQFADWTPLGTQHGNAVSSGHLEDLAPLPAGTYTLRLAVVIDGGFASQYESTFTVTQ
ncbi:transglycosylase domain-containing protein [Phototrophicus methaneseepsis]|uniref:Transglycosylase domain-containing protein n=1 Tax=Phototrophicus methaneseepsis TaxID=2710758 RepID=A0A7S8ECY3_9CHLR|nr:transglycosylase domain-containing protein [Phototrophicus methaneseepsis]QPC84639.1 transglycosylase domain-containing protein [Phototrophicus methaneseepsis]